MDAKAAKIGPQPKDVFQQIFPHLINNEFLGELSGIWVIKRSCQHIHDYQQPPLPKAMPQMKSSRLPRTEGTVPWMSIEVLVSNSS